MPIYQFSMPLDAADLEVEVVNYDSGSVTTVSDDPTEGPDGNLLWRVDLAEGDYYMRATDEPGESVFTANGTLDVVASIANVPGAAETAYFVAAGPTGPTDGGAGFALTFEADPDHGALPSWASIDGGDIVLTGDAGTCTWAFDGTIVFDFSGTTPQSSSGSVNSGYTITIDGVDLADGVVTNPNKTGDGTDTQTPPDSGAGGIVRSSIHVVSFAFANDVLDGVATPDAAVTVTRVSPAPVRPGAR